MVKFSCCSDENTFHAIDMVKRVDIYFSEDINSVCLSYINL